MTKQFKLGDKPGTYVVKGMISENDILNMAMILTRRRLSKGRILLGAAEARDYLSVKLSSLEHEVFGVIFLNQRHRILRYEEMFRGTIDSANVYPREVVKHALKLNAAAVIFVHNHPSGHAEPSQSDIAITKRLKEALALVDIRVIDHFVVGSDKVRSMAEEGLLR